MISTLNQANSAASREGYRAFGLNLSSSIRLDALEPAMPAGPPDLFLQHGNQECKHDLTRELSSAVAGGLRQYSSPKLHFRQSIDARQYQIEYSDGTWFNINVRTWQIVTGWPPHYAAADMATYFLGPVLGFVMRLKGIVCLHASSAAIDGRGIAFIGNAGAGKSTLAAALALRGVPILGDDIVALDEGGGELYIRSGYPRLRLWPDSVTSLLGDPELLPRISPSWNKRQLDLTIEGRRFHKQPTPLGAIYLLGDRVDDYAVHSFERLAPAEALIALVTNGYVSYPLDRAMQAREFEVLSRVAAGIPVWRAHPPADMQELPVFCDRLLAHITG